MLKEWFFFPKSDRRAILLLASLLVVGLCFLWWREEHHAPTEVLAVRTDSSVVALRKSASRLQKQRGITYGDTVVQHRENFYRERTSFPAKRTKENTEAWIKKLPAGTVVDLNSADTTLLKRVPGIGSWRARRIVQFRGHLGGYSGVEQLLEINGMPDTILHWFEVKTPPRKVLNLNQTTLDSMAAHPYLTYKQARVILRHKRLHGSLQSLDQLSLYDEFTQEQLERLKPYVVF